MCGRFTLKTPPDQWGQLLLPWIEDSPIPQAWQPRYNIAPTQEIVAVAMDGPSERALGSFRWGLVPFWATDLAIGNRMINARGESLLEKRSFQKPLESRRCLIVADGYYEWQKRDDGTKQPQWITPADRPVVYFAGLWDSNRRATGQVVNSCTIVTVAASPSLQPIHDRMPAILVEQAAEKWLDQRCDASEARALLGPAEDGFFTVQAVSKHVNNPRHEDSACIAPL